MDNPKDEFHYSQEEEKKGFEIKFDADGLHLKRKKAAENAYKEKKRNDRIRAWNSFPFPVVALIAFLLTGFLADAWSWCWLLLLSIPLYYLIGNAKLKSLLYGVYPLICLGVFFGVGIGLNIWHPTWLVFVSIPVYYALLDAAIKRRLTGVYSAICVLAYVTLGLTLNWWHPGWIIFLTIPIAEWIGKTFFPKKEN